MSPKKIEDITTEGWDTIHKAAYCGNYDILLEELNNGISANHISNKFKSKYKQIICKDFDIYFSNMYPLYIAAQRGHINCVQLLIDRGADPKMIANNEYFDTVCDAFSVALLHNNFKTYRLMKKLSKNKDPVISTSTELRKSLIRV